MNQEKKKPRMGWGNFFSRGPGGKYFRLSGPKWSSVTTLQPCLYSVNSATGNTWVKGCGCSPIQCYKH